MSAPGTRAGEEADDLGAEEALALVQENPRPHTRGTPARTPDSRHRAMPWPEARATAERAARAAVRAAGRAPVPVSLDAALGLTLAAALPALTDLPSFDTSAMDGWAVAGPGPWTVREDGVLAGHTAAPPLTDGEAVRIATGARVPPDTTAVLRTEHGRTEHGRTDRTEQGRAEPGRTGHGATEPRRADGPDRLHATREVVHGQDIRPRGQECRGGDQLLSIGTLVTPAVLGLAAAAGYDALDVVPRPRVDLLVLGDELLTSGLPRDGLIRDALGPMLPPWLRALGGETGTVRRIGDDAEALYRAITESAADLIVTTGGTAAGPVDHVHPVLARIGADLLVDGVRVRPGHPMLLARTGEAQYLVGLPGNPLAAVSGLLTLAEPLLRTLAARPAPEPCALPVRDAVPGHPYDTRLVPVVLRGGGALPLHYNGPAMLRGIAAADALAVVPPGGVPPGQETEILDLPWAAGGIGVCFT
ncbi:molybdopterin molybdotransferase MoeA [Streptomyces tagetis]|uniref:Molybdopterin molybdenumtransferase n=1 Tax=Streptomyces tagetis TaxID=2820809 RepID=A0A940XPV9_9ACTN|nr:molybdopterin molybdotransferase MoeA [Streptomyces sp. RG38]MBQ0827603.1 molybdopterin molybdotransferase MoeA [Streptomyces sp. RG38]